jgi:hypothetical protein
MLPPAVLQGHDPLEMSLLGSPQWGLEWGLEWGQPLQPRCRWVQKKLELGFVLELGLRRQRLVGLQTVVPETVAVPTEGLTAALLEVEPAQELRLQRELRPLELKRLPGLVLVLALELQLVELQKQGQKQGL